MYFHREKQKHSIRLRISKSQSPTRTPVNLLGTTVNLEPLVLETLEKFPAGP